MQHSEQLNELAAALARAQAHVQGAAKSATNPHFNRKYADLAAVWDACRDALTAQGLSVVQGPSFGNQQIGVTTMLLHASGQWVRSEVGVPFEVDKGRNASQSVGSAITYLRRYALAAMVGIAPEDDDGEASGEKGRAPQQESQPDRKPWLKDGVYVVPGSPEKWNGTGGKALSEVPLKVLGTVKGYFQDKDAPDLIEAIGKELYRRADAGDKDAFERLDKGQRDRLLYEHTYGKDTEQKPEALDDVSDLHPIVLTPDELLKDKTPDECRVVIQDEARRVGVSKGELGMLASKATDGQMFKNLTEPADFVKVLTAVREAREGATV